MKELLAVFLLAATTAFSQEPIRLHPDNPHYFQYNGNTTVLVTSAEHYGAVLNKAFDYTTYLKTLAADSMNYTRIFAGSYFEIPGTSFGIRNNTLAPAPDQVVVPWLTYDDQGKMRYDLESWNPDYFDRLHDFLRTAAELDIIVEVTLFSSIYTDPHWEINPQNPENTVNLSGTLDRRLVHTLENGALLPYQEAYVRKIVRDLNAYPNIFFEIQNEPWSDRSQPVYNIVNKEELQESDWTDKSDLADSLSMLWQDHMIDLIREEEASLPNQHMIAQNYANHKVPVPEVHKDVDILNFHYAWPEAVWWNLHYQKAIGFDESGFAGSEDQVYRRQAWRFMLSGGALFNNLDYSFAVGYEQGDLENEAPGGGSPALRQQLKFLRRFLGTLPLERLSSDQEAVASSPGMLAYVLSTSDRMVTGAFVQLTGVVRSELTLNLPQGEYEVTWYDPLTGNVRSVFRYDTDSNTGIPVQSESGELALVVRRLSE